ncbi:hypothetical protein G6F59_014783 [Rhizopus arrhizus]|nr:hypothetical protein G6F59_014783 [Rhizopus arrhizus]
MDRRDRLRPRAAIQQLLAHVAADGNDAVRQPGVGVERIDGLGQMPRAHDQRRAGQARSHGGQHGVAAAVGVHDVETLAPQQAPHEHHAAQEIARAVHDDAVHREAGLAQAVSEFGPGLADQLQVMAALAHGDHLFVDAEFLPAERRGRLGVQDAQAGAGVAGMRFSGGGHHGRTSLQQR